MTLDLTKAKQNFEHLLEIEVGHRIDQDSWSQDSPGDNNWYISHIEGKPSKVEEKPTGSAIIEMTERASKALCESNPSSWYWDPANERLYLHVADSGDPGDGGQLLQSYFWECFCNKQNEDVEIVFTINDRNVWYESRINNDDIPAIDTETTGYHEGGTRQSFGSLKLINADGYFDIRLSDYIYEAKRFVIRIGIPGDSYSNYQIVARGWTGGVWWSDEDIEIEFEDPRIFF